MDVGTKLNLQFKGSNTRVTSEFVGLVKGDYLIIKMPSLTSFKDVKSLIYRESDIVVRYLHKGTIYGFQSRIRDTIISPAKLIFIEYPKKFENYELRSNKRIDCFLPASIEILDRAIEGSITDISREGCQFIVETSKVKNNMEIFKVDGEIKVSFLLPGLKEKIVVDTRQKNIKKDKDSVNIGFWFFDMDIDEQEKFHNFLSTAKA